MAAFRKKDLKKPSITFNVSSIEVLSDSKVNTTKIALPLMLVVLKYSPIVKSLQLKLHWNENMKLFCIKTAKYAIALRRRIKCCNVHFPIPGFKCIASASNAM